LTVPGAAHAARLSKIVVTGGVTGGVTGFVSGGVGGGVGVDVAVEFEGYVAVPVSGGEDELRLRADPLDDTIQRIPERKRGRKEERKKGRK
jgi:hypothetical protein